MPIPILGDIISKGLYNVPYAVPTLKTVACLLAIYLLKLYFGGASNTSERLMRSKVVMITGGTSGVGASVAHELALRGASVILLTRLPPSDPFLVDYIDDMRATTKNQLIYAEQVDLSSLHSIRLFATKWVDNAPPRRLDMVILCADTFTPRFGEKLVTDEKLEVCWGINYLANFHLLSILSPALRAQTPDRDVRIVFTTCSSYIGGDLKKLKDTRTPLPPGREYGTSKLATMVFAQAFQKHLDNYQRPDNQPNNARVILVDPGYSRTPGMRRWLTMGSLWGLLLYLTMWPIWWLILKSPMQGAQSILRATMEAELGRGVGGRFIKECREREVLRGEVRDEKVAKGLWEFSERQIEALEKEGAVRRAREKKEREELEKKGSKEKADDAEQKTNNDAKEKANGRIEEIVDDAMEQSGKGKKKGSRRSRKA